MRSLKCRHVGSSSSMRRKVGVGSMLVGSQLLLVALLIALCDDRSVTTFSSTVRTTNTNTMRHANAFVGGRTYSSSRRCTKSLRSSALSSLLLSPTKFQKQRNHNLSSSSTSSSSSSSAHFRNRRFGTVSTCRLMAVTQDEEHGTATATATTSTTAADTGTVDLDEVQRLRREAQRMRLQADQMDLNLTLEKIDALERKLNNRSWLDRHPDAEKVLREQLQRLSDKFAQTQSSAGSSTSVSTSVGSSSTATSSVSQSTASSSTTSPSTAALTSQETTKESTSAPISSSPSQPSRSNSPADVTNRNNKKLKKSLIPPIAGFDQTDLDLYIPVANDINKMSAGTNTSSGVPLSLKERMALFQAAPELQQHFQEKLTKLLMGPIAEMQQLEELKKQFLQSSSRTERTNLKRQIDQLQKSIDDGGPLGYSDSIYVPEDVLPPLTEEALNERVKAIQSLPDILIASYMQRTGVAYKGAIIGPYAEEGRDDDSVNDIDKIRLAIQLDYYDTQLQLLDQTRILQPLTDNQKEEFLKAYDLLPEGVKRRFATNIGMTTSDGKPVEHAPEANEVLGQLLKRDSAISPLLKAIEESNDLSDPPEYDDIEFVDRSRYLEELFPAIERLEAQHPSEEDAELFANEILGKGKLFMVTSKPERVIGGYYIRGKNLLSDDKEDKSAADKLVEEVSSRLESNGVLKDRLDFFYIIDPATPTDEDLEMGEDSSPLFLITAKNEKDLYRLSRPLTKSIITLGGIGSSLAFSIGACVLNERIGGALESLSLSSIIDPSLVFSLCLPLFGSVSAIIVAHEVAHRLVASYHKFDVGIPNIIPSIQFGVIGAITPLKSPPPNSKALFDFAIAGPLAGFAVSLALLFNGLELTQHMSLNSPLPVLPVDLVRSSSLGGGLVQFFLGKLAILPDQGPNALIELHPTAIAGIIGCYINALALLPIGHTDGGRISLVMFGRRGAYVNQVFTVLGLVLAGLVGLDNSNILLVYTLYSLVWQRELEAPVRNEVDELDVSRGLVAIAASLLVGLTLIPMF